ncbi:MAG: hypothetical protein QOI20_3122, partial [Acidimicrobiaceae bacterium]|nr:hypothetical protein [Acidimicrobiaceae bacterium]
MKVGIVAPSPVPFILGGAERLFNGLTRAVNELTPHDAELIKLPTREHTLPDLMASYEAWSQLDVSHFDLVVSTKYPAWMVDHPNHVVYLQHTLRGLYDTYPADLPQSQASDVPEVAALQQALGAAVNRSALPDVFGLFGRALAALGSDHPVFALPGPLAHELVHSLDRIGMSDPGVRRHLAISATVAARPGYFPVRVEVRPVHHPSDLVGFRCETFDYFFTASRLDGPKRVHLLIEAMRHVPADVPLKIAGTGPDMARLRQAAQRDPRIELLGYVETARLLDLYAGALAVPFVPADEDLGLITLEAMMSGKPVVTALDSGGATELVADSANGFVVPPTAAAIGTALARLARDVDMARAMGAAGRLRAQAVTWERTVAAILDEGAGPARGSAEPGAPAGALAVGRVQRRTRRARRLVVVSTFPIHPRMGGGQLRCFHLYRHLASRFDVEAVCLGGPQDVQQEIELAPGYVETVVPKSAEHEAAERAIHAEAGLPVTDIVASMHIDKTPAYLEALHKASLGADAVILADPFQQPAVAMVAPDVPTVYDSFNAEIVLKRTLLPDNDMGRLLLDTVRRVEGASIRDSLVVSVCSSEDQAMLELEYGLDTDKLVYTPNGVDSEATPYTGPDDRAEAREHWLRRFSEMSGLRGLRRIAFFAGSWHLPNIDAGKHIIAMAPSLPDVVFLLVGHHGQEFTTWSLPPNVVLTGIVSEPVKQALLACSDVALNPMVRGSGTNLKIVEYFAAGVPVVSTRLGSRGLAVQPGVHLRSVELEDFADAIRAVLDDEAGAAVMAAESRRVVEEHYDWAVLGKRLRLKLESTLLR